MPISYDRAFGGVDVLEEQPDKPKTYLANPVGVGYFPLTHGKALEGKHLPNTEEKNREVTAHDVNYRPMAFGPIGRNFDSRVQYAGTYDGEWLRHRAPFWPENFDYRYFQAAPPDQQINYPNGGEEIVLSNLTSAGQTRFMLPKIGIPIIFLPQSGKDILVDAAIDTLLLEPDRERISVTWRAMLPLRRNCFEIKQIIAGKMSRAWYRARAGGKRYFQGLDQLAASRRPSKW